MPAILTVTPVPELSMTFHVRRTVAEPPIVTLDGFALNVEIDGAGHAVAVTVVGAVACAPQLAVAVRL